VPPPPGTVDSRRDRWIVDSLVGQVNGRPIFADEFLEPMADRLTQAVAQLSRGDARLAIIQEVSQRFDQWVDSELVIAEAESLLTPEEKQGLFAFLKDLQETEILQRGGTRTSAEESVQEQYGGATLQDVLDVRKNSALAGNLLQKRVRPRTIVTWRDMERDFGRRAVEFSPGPTYVLGRIQLNTRNEAAKIDQATEMFAQGKSFSEVTAALGIPDDGRWEQGTFTLGPEGLDGTDFRDELKAQIKPLKVGDVSPAFKVGGTTVWLSLLSKDEPPPRSIYERELQLALRSQLEQEREAIERGRYVASLRRQWVTEGIETMRTRLIDIALKRYWQ